MESLLNSLWLLFVIVGCLLFLRTRSDHSVVKSLAVLACVAVLLFPAISITDDLHPDFNIVVEEVTKRILHVQAPAALVHLHVALALTTTKLPLRRPGRSSAVYTLPSSVFPISEGLVRAVTGRAPPAASA